MAWQSSAVGNGGGPAASTEGNGGAPPLGTEYTLQGVMRFLQSEWHRHERDRNAWEIERAEMKSRIGKLEGDGRTAKRLQETLGKHVKMLENALRRERENCRKLQQGESVDSAKSGGEPATENRIDVQASPSKASNLLQDLDADGNLHNDIKQDPEREKSRLYLSKCVQEVTYHVVPTTLAQQALADEQEQALQNHQYSNQLGQPSLQDMYAQQQRTKPPVNHTGISGPNSLHNHQAPQSRSADLSLSRSGQLDPTPFYGRNTEESMLNSGGPPNHFEGRNISRQQYAFPSQSLNDDPATPYDAFDEQMPADSSEAQGRRRLDADNTDSEAWNFEVETEQPHAEGRIDFQSMPTSETDPFPSAIDSSSSPQRGPASRRKSSLSKRRTSDGSHELRDLSLAQSTGSLRGESSNFKVRFALRGHLDVVRSVIFTGGGTPAEPEICTTGDDGVIKRWIIPASYSSFGGGGAASNDLDISSYFTHRGHQGAVMCLAAAPALPNFLNGGRALGDGWVFSGGQDATIRVWERGRVDPKATLDGHTDAVWTICVLPSTAASILGDQSARHADRVLLASGSADGTILIWAVSSPPQLTSPSTGSRRGAGASRRANSISSGSNFPSSPQPSTATTIPFHYTLVHRIERLGNSSPTCISPLSPTGVNFLVSFSDASVLLYDTRTAEEIVGMASQETYDGTPATGVNAAVATTMTLDAGDGPRHGSDEDLTAHGATGSSSGAEGMVISGHEDRYIRFFDANSGQCTYNMLAHPAAISALSLSPDARELVSAGHDASLRFWSLEKRTCTQEITSHRLMRGEGVCTVQWSADGRWVVSGGGDGTVKVWTR